MLFNRYLDAEFAKALEKPFVHIIFGARQTGKSSLIRRLIPHPALEYDFSNPIERTRMLADPGVFIRECEALRRAGEGFSHFVVVDEAQNVSRFLMRCSIFMTLTRRAGGLSFWEVRQESCA